MLSYSKRMRDRMLNAARLTRTRRLLETTAFIHRTVHEALKPQPQSTEGHPSAEPYVEGSFRVVEADAPESNLREVEVTIINPSAPAEGETLPETQLILPPLLPSPGKKTRPGHRVETPPPDIEAPPTDVPDQTKGRFIKESFTCKAGARAYKLYIPSSYQGQELPLVVMLHGCTQSPDEFAAATRMNEFAETHSFFVAYPAQTFKANLGKCWNWFKASEQQRDRGEPAIIAGLTRQIIDTYGLDRQQVYIAGISAGGAMAMIMGMTHPDLYAASGIQSGVPYGVAHNLLSGLAATKGVGSISAERLRNASGGKAKLRAVPTIVFHGDQDSLVNPNNSDQIIAQWLELTGEAGQNQPTPQVTLDRGQIPGGHAYTRSIYHDWNGLPLMEQWLVHGAGHAWSGGNPSVAWTDAKGPDASQEMLRFFFQHPHPET